MVINHKMESDIDMKIFDDENDLYSIMMKPWKHFSKRETNLSSRMTSIQHYRHWFYIQIHIEVYISKTKYFISNSIA